MQKCDRNFFHLLLVAIYFVFCLDDICDSTSDCREWMELWKWVFFLELEEHYNKAHKKWQMSESCKNVQDIFHLFHFVPISFLLESGYRYRTSIFRLWVKIWTLTRGRAEQFHWRKMTEDLVMQQCEGQISSSCPNVV